MTTSGHNPPCTYEPDLWFPDNYKPESVALPIQICNTVCLFKAVCKEAATVKDWGHGVWAGTTPADRNPPPPRVNTQRTLDKWRARDAEVARLFAAGHTRSSIAMRLGISTETVRASRARWTAAQQQRTEEAA